MAHSHQLVRATAMAEVLFKFHTLQKEKKKRKVSHSSWEKLFRGEYLLSVRFTSIW